jgi:hypothetical protein
MAYEGLMSAIANPQIADVAGALDYRQNKIMEEQKRQKDAKVKELMSQAITGLRKGSVLSEMANEDPERYMMFTKAMGIPANEGEKLEQLSQDVRQIAKIASADPEGAMSFVNNLAAEREQMGLDVSKLRQWQELATQDYGKAQRAISMLDETLNADLISAERMQERKMQLQERGLDIQERRLLSGGDAPAGLQEFSGMTEGLSKEDKERARRIALGLDPRATGSAAITTATSGLTDVVAESEAKITGKTKMAEGTAKDVVDYKKSLFDSINSNSRMLNKYNFAIKQLDEGAQTGPVIRSLPNLKEQSVLVDVVRKEIGMEILGSGLLGVNPTDRDVDFALTTAIPDNLMPDALKRELQRRSSILQDINAAQEEYYRLIEEEGMTKGDILKLAKARREQKREDQNAETQGETAAQRLARLRSGN